MSGVAPESCPLSPTQEGTLSARPGLGASTRSRRSADLLEAEPWAKRFEDYEPRSEDTRDPSSLEQLRDAVLARSEAERSIRDAVAAARSEGQSWAAIGSLLGTSGEAARQRYGRPQTA